MKGNRGFAALSTLALILSTGFYSYADVVTVADDESKSWATAPATDGIRFTGSNASGTYSTTGGADGNTIAAVTVDNTALLGVGTLDFYHSTTVSGDIGDASHNLSVIQLKTAGKTVTINGDSYVAVLFDFDADGTLAIANGKDFSGIICGNVLEPGDDNIGTLSLGGDNNFSQLVGWNNTLRLKQVTGAATGTSTFYGDVFAKDIEVSTGKIVFTGDQVDTGAGGVLNFAAAGTVEVEDNCNIESAITAAGGAGGILTFDGTSNVNTTGGFDIGQAGAALTINANGGLGETLTLGGNTYATTLNFGGNGTVSVADNKNLTAAVTTSTPNTGTLNFAGTSTATGQIGTIANPLLLVKAAGSPESLTLNGDVYASEIYVADDGTVVFSDGADYNNGAAAGSITTESDWYGYIQFRGSSVINGSIGTALENFYEIRLDQADPSDVVEVTGDLYIIDGNGVNFDSDGELIIGGDFYGVIENDTAGTAGTVTFGGNAELEWLGFPLRRVNANGTGTSIVATYGFETETLSFGGDGTVTLEDGTITIGSVLNSSGTDSSGTLGFHADSTVTGNVGAPGASLKAILLDNNNVNLDLQGDVYAGTLGFGEGEEHSDGEIEIGGTAVIGPVTTLYDDFGTLTLEGNGTVNGDMGADGAALRAVNIVGAAGTTVTVNGDIWAFDMTVDAGSLLMNGSFTDPGDPPTTLNFSSDGFVTLAAGNNISSNITTGTDGTGTLSLGGANTITGNIGGAGAALKLIELTGSGATVTQAGNTVTKGISLGSGRMDIDGTFDISDGGSIAAGIEGTASCGKVVSTGAATVPATATVNVSVSGYVPSGATFTIVDGTGGTGVAGGLPVTSNSRILTFAAVATDSEDLMLTATRAHSYGNATTGEASVIGAILEQIGESGASGDMLTILNELDTLPDDESLQAALDTLAPVVDSGTVTASNTSLNQFIATVIDRLGALFARSHGSAGPETGVSAGSSGKSGLEAWGQGFGEYVKQKPRGTSNGYRATVWGTALGADIPAFNDRVRLGLSGGYAATGINSKDNSGKTDIDSYQGTLYAGYIDPEHPYYLNGSFSFAYNKYEGKRHIAVGTITRTADADYDGQQYSVLLDGGYTFKAKPVNITPVASLQYMRLHLEGYTETGAGALDLNMNSQNYDMLQSGLGVKFDRAFETGSGTVIPEVHVRWLHDFIGDRQETTSTFAGGGGSFATQGFEPAQNALNVGAKLALITRGSWSIETNYDFEYKEDFAAHTGWAEARYKF